MKDFFFFLKRGFFLITSNKWFSEIKDGGKKIEKNLFLFLKSNTQTGRETQQRSASGCGGGLASFSVRKRGGLFPNPEGGKIRTLKNRTTTCLFIVSFLFFLSFLAPFFGGVLFSAASTNWVKHHLFQFF